MKRIALVALATVLLACGLVTASPAGATYQGHVTWWAKYDSPGPQNYQCAKGFEVGTSVYGHAYVNTANYGYGYGNCTQSGASTDVYDTPYPGWYAYRVRLDYAGGSAYTSWIYAGSGHVGIDSQFSLASPYPAQAIRACIEVADYIWQSSYWRYQYVYGYCMTP